MVNPKIMHASVQHASIADVLSCSGFLPTLMKITMLLVSGRFSVATVGRTAVVVNVTELRDD